MIFEEHNQVEISFLSSIEITEHNSIDGSVFMSQTPIIHHTAGYINNIVRVNIILLIITIIVFYNTMM